MNSEGMNHYAPECMAPDLSHNPGQNACFIQSGPAGPSEKTVNGCAIHCVTVRRWTSAARQPGTLKHHGVQVPECGGVFVLRDELKANHQTAVAASQNKSVWEYAGLPVCTQTHILPFRFAHFLFKSRRAHIVALNCT